MAKRTGLRRHSLVGVAIVISAWLSATPATAAQRGSDEKEDIAHLQFVVSIEGTAVGQFREVSGLSAEVEVIEYRDGDGSIRKLPGRTKYPNVVLKRGFAPDGELWQWFQKVVGGAHDARDVTVAILDRHGEPVATYVIHDAFPVKYEVPTLSASGNEVATETLTIAHDGFRRE